MKKIVVFIICLSFGFVGFSQISRGNDIVTPYQGELAAVKNGNLWGFIDENGLLVIDYRNDFVLEPNSELKESYPKFKYERCLIRKIVNGVYHYGFIDTKGKETIPAVFLNATDFQNGFAIVVTLLTDSIGFNKVLKKNVTSSKLEEYVIDTSGRKMRYLENPLTYSKLQQSMKSPPKIRSKFIAPRIVAVLKKNDKWDIYKF